MSDAEGWRRRLEREAGIVDLATALAKRLQMADLHSLLREVFRRRAAGRTSTQVLDEYAGSRFTQPASADPRLLLEWDRVAFAALPEGFVPLELAPLCPLATSSAVATVSPDKSLATIRGLEVVSDGTNVLALEGARRRRALLQARPQDATPVELAASHRLVRPQRYSDPRLCAHFRLFHLISAGRDTGNHRFEREALARHLGVYLRALATFLSGALPLRVRFTALSDRVPTWLEETAGALADAFPQVEFGFAPERTAGRGYYRSVCFHVHAAAGGEWLELADGGDTDWTRKLLHSAKERLMISAIGAERVGALAATSPESTSRSSPGSAAE